MGCTSSELDEELSDSESSDSEDELEDDDEDTLAGFLASLFALFTGYSFVDFFSSSFFAGFCYTGLLLCFLSSFSLALTSLFFADTVDELKRFAAALDSFYLQIMSS